MKKVTIICCILAAVILSSFGLLTALRWYCWQPAREMERTAAAMVGHPEADLISVLGQPTYVVTSATLAGRTVDYPWKGMNLVPIPNHPVRNKVLLYLKLDRAIYVYVDEHGVIEYVAAAGT